MKRREFLASLTSATLSYIAFGCNHKADTSTPNILFCIADDDGYLNCDGSPAKTEILNQNRNSVNKEYWTFGFGYYLGFGI